MAPSIERPSRPRSAVDTPPSAVVRPSVVRPRRRRHGPISRTSVVVARIPRKSRVFESTGAVDTDGTEAARARVMMRFYLLVGLLASSAAAACSSPVGQLVLTDAVANRQSDGREQVLVHVSCEDGPCADWALSARWFSPPLDADGGITCGPYHGAVTALDNASAGESSIDQGLLLEESVTSDKPLPAASCVTVSVGVSELTIASPSP